ncbi:MAG: allophanate hydrolase, partial [Pseudomonadota bacterium]
LKAAGALLIGKTNLDQFATGLNGLRTPKIAPRNALDPSIVPGGSSSGSGVVVAHGIVPFSLGTDTAGSGRVPAALNNIVGLKPTLGALSTRGVVPACRTLDAVSIFALTIEDAHTVFRIAAAYDGHDPFSKKVPAPRPSRPPAFTLGVPRSDQLVFLGDAAAQRQGFDRAVGALEAVGAQVHEFDIAPFFEIAQMLYQGPWVAERAVVIAPLLARSPQSVLPVIQEIVGVGDNQSAADTFRAIYRLAELRRIIEPTLQLCDGLCVPSIPGVVTVEEMLAAPIEANNQLGTYTNFVNLLDLCGLALPLPMGADGRPGSVTLLAKAGRDGFLAALGAILEADVSRTLGATSWPAPMPEAAASDGYGAAPGEIEIAVCGAHMSGLPLNGELTRLGARFCRAARTTADYGFFALPGSPPRPGLVRREDGSGARVAVEVWALPEDAVGPFLAGIPAPLGLGTIRLADGTNPKGFLCEAVACAAARDVSDIGDWRRVVAAEVGPSS